MLKVFLLHYENALIEENVELCFIKILLIRDLESIYTADKLKMWHPMFAKR